VLLDNSYHMVTIDRDRRTVIARTTEFVARIASGAAPREGRLAEAAGHGQ
jgi:carboxylesterase